MLSLILIGPQLTQFLLNILGSKGKREKKRGRKRRKKERAENREHDTASERSERAQNFECVRKWPPVSGLLRSNRSRCPAAKILNAKPGLYPRSCVNGNTITHDLGQTKAALCMKR